MTTQVDLEVIRGDDAIFDIVIRDSAGQTVNLQGGELKFTARSSSSSPTTTLEKSSNVPGEITFTDATHGMASLALVPADTSGLYAPLSLVYDFEFVSGNGGGVTTVLPAGILYVRRDITHA